MKTLYVDFSHLKDIPESFKNDLTEKIMETIRAKYEGTNIYITDNFEATKIATNDGSVDSVRIHNNPDLDYSDDALGNAFPDYDVAEVDMQDFIEKGFGISAEVLGEQIGVVASHEGFHLLGPGGHSNLNDNLMSQGELTSESIRETGGSNLEFTDLQKSILNGNIDNKVSMKLYDIEDTYYEWLEGITEVDDIEDVFVEFLDSLI